MEVLSYGYFVAVMLGLALGSFAGATVWRLRARQLQGDVCRYEVLKNAKKLSASDKDELAWLRQTKKERTAELKYLKPLTAVQLKSDRSQCLKCHHSLAWYDLIPLVSWASTGGKCRYCRQPIGAFEPLMELGSAGLFVLFYHFWLTTQGMALWPQLVLWAVVLVLLVILFAYDSKWFLLPDVVVFPLIGLALALAVWQILGAPAPLEALGSTVGAVAILGGLYLVLWRVSGGAWVGFGDVKLGLALGLLLGDWLLAFAALFLANVLGLLVVLPGLLRGRVSRTSHVPFGPMLIAGFFITLFYGGWLIQSYLGLTNGLIIDTLML